MTTVRPADAPPPLSEGLDTTPPPGMKLVQMPSHVLMPSFMVPDGTHIEYGADGKLYHAVRVVPETLGGKPSWRWRRLATSLEEARAQRIDFYHPTLGLIWNGTKLARDRTPEDIMRDSSVGGLVPPGELPVEQAGFDSNAESASE